MEAVFTEFFRDHFPFVSVFFVGFFEEFDLFGCPLAVFGLFKEDVGPVVDGGVRAVGDAIADFLPTSFHTFVGFAV